jgi:RimJ/RimL family protein N-acetyltransferase
MRSVPHCAASRPGVSRAAESGAPEASHSSPDSGDIPPGMRPFPISLHTARLTLHLPDDQDARLEHEMILESLDHLWPWFSFRAEPPTLAQRMELAARQRADAAAGTGATYVVFARNQAVGTVWLEVQGPKATMGWWLRAGATGHGYATEAVRALSELAFDFGVERVEAHTDPDNAPSRALAERAGFVLHEILQDVHDRPDGVRRRTCVYALLSGRNLREREIGGDDRIRTGE